MAQINDVNLELFHVRTETNFSNYAAEIDTINKTVTIISRPIENLSLAYRLKNVSIVKQQQITQSIRQE